MGYGSWGCLSEEMARSGHTLRRDCGPCGRACVYSAPCGCGSSNCIDLVIGAGRSGLAAAA